MWTLYYQQNKQKDSRFPRCSVYIYKQSNHQPNIIADIPKAIYKRLRNISCNENAFDRNIDIYQTALKTSGFDGTITYHNQSEQAKNVNIEEANQARKLKRAIIWYNPPYSKNVKTNIGKAVFELLQKHFPPTHPMYTIFNKSTIKTSYSCFPNIGCIISSHTKHILNSNCTEYGCNCGNRGECPLENKCLTPRIVYRTDVTKTKLMNPNIIMVSQTLHSKNVMKIIKRLSDIYHIWLLQICLSITGDQLTMALCLQLSLQLLNVSQVTPLLITATYI